MKIKVSVVMAVHNGMPFLPEAIESILQQSLRDLEFIVVDDGSSDESAEVVESYADERVRLIRNGEQMGLAQSLNIGIDMAEGEFIARMDADDVSAPQRLAKQVAYLHAHPQVDTCGTWARTIGDGKVQHWHYAQDDAAIKAEMLFASVLVHSSVMMRKSSLEAHRLRYDATLQQAQDYELWSRAADKLKFANVPEILMRYRLHVDQIGEKSTSGQQNVADMVRERLLGKLGIKFSETELQLHNDISRWQFGEQVDYLERIGIWLTKILDANKLSQVYSDRALAGTLEGRWWAASRAHVGEGLAAWRSYITLDIAQGGNRSSTQKTIFWAKCMLREWGIR